MADTVETFYHELSDSELIVLLRSGDAEALSILCVRYLPLCRRLAGQYGRYGDNEDLAQEGMIGLLQAARRYDPSRGVPFESYGRRCITSKIFSALDAMRAQKRKANVSSIPLDEHQLGLQAACGLHISLPEDQLIEKEEIHRRSEQIQSLLTSSEKDTLSLYLRGFSYAQIAAQLGIPMKSVDNALQRVRRKLKTVF